MAPMQDHAGGDVGNEKLILALLMANPGDWASKAKIKAALKLTDIELAMALDELRHAGWVTSEPATDDLQLGGAASSSAYFVDSDDFKQALRAAQDRAGAARGTG